MEKENKLRKVSGVMNRSVKRVRKDTSMRKVVETMAENKISCVVVTESRKPLGVITERDILKKVVLKNLDVDKTKAEQVMSKKLVTVTPENDLVPTGRLMKKRKVRRFPVINNNKNLVGIVTETDILEGIISLVKHLDWKLVKMRISVAEYAKKLKESKFL